MKKKFWNKEKLFHFSHLPFDGNENTREKNPGVIFYPFSSTVAVSMKFDQHVSLVILQT